jgi:hypothetical protein
MKRILLDECCPAPLSRELAGHKVFTVDSLGWKGRENRLLVRSAEAVCDVPITADQSLRYQQNLSGRRLAIIELPFNSWPRLQPMTDLIQSAVDAIRPGEYVRLSCP